MTEREFLSAVAETSPTEEMQAYITARLAKMNEQNAKLTPTQKENLVIKDLIYERMTIGEPTTLRDIGTLVNDTYPDLSNQKLSQLMTQMRESGKAEKSTIKNVVYYTKL